MEEEIFDEIIKTFESRTHAFVKWVAGHPVANKGIDGTLIIHFGDEKIVLPVEIKGTITRNHLYDLVKQTKYHRYLTVMATNIQPQLREELKDLGINFLDASGHVYIKQERTLIYLDGNKKPRQRLDFRERPFNKAGLKVVYQFLIDKRSIDLTIREIAFRADVSLDSAHKTINGLKELDYLVPIDKTKMKWKNRRDLLEKWVLVYDTRLKPAQYIGSFRFIDENDYLDWRTMAPGPLTQWGSEPAGDIYTNNLKPQILTLYTAETKGDLIKKLRIVPDEEGDIHIYRKFWNYDPNENENVAVNPILAYADLVNTGNKRNIETANRILHEYIQDQL